MLWIFREIFDEIQCVIFLCAFSISLFFEPKGIKFLDVLHFVGTQDHKHSPHHLQAYMGWIVLFLPG